MATDQTNDTLLSSLAVVILLVGTATGSAFAMLVMSAVLLAVMVIFRRKHLRSGPVMVALVAAVVAIVIAGFFTLRAL